MRAKTRPVPPERLLKPLSDCFTRESAKRLVKLKPDRELQARLKELGLTLPAVPPAVANYLPYRVAGNLLFLAGQGPRGADGKFMTGKVGGEVSVEDGQRAARACAINLLAQIKAGLGDLDKVIRVVRLGGFINSAPGFADGPQVMNGASDLMVAVFGDRGRHARTTVGVSALPLDAAIEVEGSFEVD